MSRCVLTYVWRTRIEVSVRHRGGIQHVPSSGDRILEAPRIYLLLTHTLTEHFHFRTRGCALILVSNPVDSTNRFRDVHVTVTNTRTFVKNGGIRTGGKRRVGIGLEVFTTHGSFVFRAVTTCTGVNHSSTGTFQKTRVAETRNVTIKRITTNRFTRIVAGITSRNINKLSRT